MSSLQYVYKGRLKLVQGHMTILNFKDGSLSAVIGLYAIMQLPSEEQIEIIAKISGWLKANGRLLVDSEPSPVEGEVWGKWLVGKDGLQYGPGREAMIQNMDQNGYNIDLELFSAAAWDNSRQGIRGCVKLNDNYQYR